MKNFIKVFGAITFLAMIAVNALANVLPLNGILTGAVSQNYANLFTPTAITFSIWGLIYLLLTGYVFYQFKSKKILIEKIGLYFSISSIANALWIFCWHYNLIGLSILFMFIIFLSLLKINNYLKKEELNRQEKFLMALPFNVYFGWITVATIANIIVFLVSLGFDGFNASYIIGFLILGTILGSLEIFKTKSFAYGLVLIWAYLGILIKHTSLNGFYSEYPSIIFVTIFSLVVFISSLFYLKKN